MNPKGRQIGELGTLRGPVDATGKTPNSVEASLGSRGQMAPTLHEATQRTGGGRRGPYRSAPGKGVPRPWVGGWWLDPPSGA